MASYQLAIRDGVEVQLNAVKAGSVITDYVVESTYFPDFILEEVGDKVQIAICAMGMGAERNRELRTTSVKKLTLSVIVHVLKKMTDSRSNTELDPIVELVEQLMAACEDDELVSGAKFKWESTEPLKDENGMIYDYESLSESGVFQSVFVLQYTYILQ